MKALVLSLTVLVALGAAAPAPAQTVYNPTIVEFVPSADHDATLPDGTPLVTRYELRVFLEGATEPFGSQDLGKPTPVNGKITAVNRQWFVGAAMGSAGFAKVAAIGPAGEGVSEPSNPFLNVPVCAAPSSVLIR